MRLVDLFHRDPCRRQRKSLDDWLDQRTVTPLPSSIADHLRACSRCRQYVSQWSAFELRARSLREEWPCARDLAVTSQADHRVGPATPRWSFATLAAALSVAVILVLVLVFTYHLLVDHPGTIARHTVIQHEATNGTQGSMAPDLPVAATR